MHKMSHFVCKGMCKMQAETLSVCETEGCGRQWEILEECACLDGRHGAGQEVVVLVVKDSNGQQLQDGDSVTVIKDLPLKGSSQVIKRGTKVKNIRLTEDPAEVDCKIGGTAIVLRTEFLKKL